jgi:hypothetical protein
VAALRTSRDGSGDRGYRPFDYLVGADDGPGRDGDTVAPLLFHLSASA